MKLAILHCACLVAVAGAAAAETDYSLSARPTVETGERVAMSSRRYEKYLSVGKDGSTGYAYSSNIRCTETQTVEGPGGDTPRLIRRDVEDAEMTCKLRRAGEDVISRRFALHDASCPAARDGRYYRSDTTNVRSYAHDALTAPQSVMLGKLLNDGVRFGGLGLSCSRFMPPHRVKVGQCWRMPSPELGELTDGASAFDALARVRVEGSMCLAAVADGIAEVRGSATFDFDFAGMPARGRLSLVLKKDLKTNRPASEEVDLKLVGRSGNRVFTWEWTSARQAIAAPDEGDEPQIGERAHDVGWQAAPRKDRNNRRLRDDGVSFYLPSGYHDKDASSEGGLLFVADNGSSLNVQVKRPALLSDLDALAGQARRQLFDGVGDFRLTATEFLRLPGGVPACLLRGTARGGRIVLYTLLACDEMRMVSILATAPASSAKDASQAERAARSLRLFAPASLAVP